MANPTFRRWTADDIAKLKNLAQQQRPADIATRASGERRMASSSGVSPAVMRLGRLRWVTFSFFCTVQTADKAPSKPHPGMILQALNEAAVKAEDAIMIGDTAFDIEMARAADVRGVAVSWGYHRPDRLRDAGAWRVVNGMSELRDCLFESISSASREPTSGINSTTPRFANRARLRLCGLSG